MPLSAPAWLPETGQVKEGFRSFFKALAMGELRGHPGYDRFLSMERDEIQHGPTDEPNYYLETIDALDALYQAGGLDAIRGLLPAVWEDLVAGRLEAERVLELTGRPAPASGQGGTGNG